MKIKKLEKLKAYILEEPRRYRQAAWFYGPDSGTMLEQNPPCGTIGCLAGNACVMEGYKVTWDQRHETARVRKPGNRKTFAVSDIARKILGLTQLEANRLFSGHPDDFDWSRKASEAYFTATTPEGRAQAAAMELDRLIRKAKRRKK